MALRLKVEKPMIKDNTDRVKNAESSIVQQAEQIALKVSEESFNALAGRVTSAEASITVQANNIASRVSKTEYNGVTIASLINQSADEVKIAADKITLEGVITANGFFKVLADGSIEAVNAKLSGSITATRMVSTAGAGYYGEIGVTGGIAGLGLFDTRYGYSPYFRVVEAILGSSIVGFNILDEAGATRMRVSRGVTEIFGPEPDTYISIAGGMINIVVNNTLVKQYT